MLNRLRHGENTAEDGSSADLSAASVSIRKADFNAPFPAGLEYAAPARGSWNIVHQGMLIPEAHQIFVCAEGCLRGVVLTAAEMGAGERFSMISIREENVLKGDMEDLITDGVSDILKKLRTLPPAVLIYTSCIHHFMGCDLPLVYKRLREKFPTVSFTDCYMNPIMRKSGLTPDQIMRKQLYSLLEPAAEKKENVVDLIGSSFPMEETGDMMRMLRNGGKTVRDLTLCRTYAEYRKMNEASVCISVLPPAKAAGEELEKRLGMKHLYLPFCYGYDEIRENLGILSEKLKIPEEDRESGIALAEKALLAAHRLIGDTPVAIDYTATPRPLGLARLLTEHGFCVSGVYADSFTGEEKEDFLWLQRNAPELVLHPTAEVSMRVMPRHTEKKLLAFGQKAAYFTGTRFFVNTVEAAGLYGYDGVRRTAEMMMEAYLHEKDTKTRIQVKGLGCGCCV